MTTNASSPFEVPVSGGRPGRADARLRLHGGRWGEGAGVLAVHGITATHLAWLGVAEQLPGVGLLAPDLRGRGRSASLPGPYGFAVHVADLVALLDAEGVQRVVIAGHSMGAFIAVALAAQHPDRVSELVLVDGGLPTGRPGDPSPPGGIDALLGPAAARLRMTFATPEAYREHWRAHPAMGQIWGPAVQAYVDYDLTGAPPELRPSAREEAMRVDGAEVADHAAAAAALQQVRAPITFLRAERGLLDEPSPFYPEEMVRRARELKPSMQATTVTDTNHYSLLMGERGSKAVARAVSDALRRVGEPRRTSA